MNWNPFVYKGKEYSLSHLDSFEWSYAVLASTTRPACTYRFMVTFSHHCFTRDPLPDEEIDEALWYPYEREPRLFCSKRYEASRLLPVIIRKLNESQVWHTHHGNFFTIELMDDETGEQIEYEVYFDVTRATRKGWLFLTVQSAYIRTEEYQSSRPKKRKIRLDVIAFNRLKGKAIKPPPG